MSDEKDLELLRRFEPIIRFTRGERFYPMDVEPYVRCCSLWLHRPGAVAPVCLVPPGELTLERLGEVHPAEFGAIHYLKLTEPLSITEMAAYMLNKRRGAPANGRLPSAPGVRADGRSQWRAFGQEFRWGRGRLARVGYGARFLDAIFSLTLLARGRVPGDTAAAANLVYAGIQAEGEQYSYHGRVLRQDGWVVLQYWLFYLFNNWRSGFSGANDHEADWEIVSIYLSETDDGIVAPEWVACSLHDYAGDDLRRRWDDPEVQKVGEHPVLFVGAGSHATYFMPGEYLAEIEVPLLRPLVLMSDRLERIWHDWLRQYHKDDAAEPLEKRRKTFHIPFVEYARGDGLSVGPGQQKEWDRPRLITPTATWATRFRGLWGLYTRDPLEGEDAPAGPMFNRNGSVRRAWYSPVGWVGLDKVAPPDEALDYVRAQKARLRAHQEALQAEATEKSRELRGRGVEVAAMRRAPHLSKIHETHLEVISALSQEVDQLREEITRDQALLEALEGYEARLERGERPHMRAHIRHAVAPTTEQSLGVDQLAELWAAISVGLLFLVLVTIIWLTPRQLVVGLTAISALFIFVEAAFRGHLTKIVTSGTLLLAGIASLVLLYEFYWQVILLVVLLIGFYISWDNLREFWRGRRPYEPQPEPQSPTPELPAE